VIFDFGKLDKLDNLPIGLKYLYVYDKQNKTPKYSVSIIEQLKDKYKNFKIPFGCEFYVNNVLFNN
jgi:hypothetical protein